MERVIDNEHSTEWGGRSGAPPDHTEGLHEAYYPATVKAEGGKTLHEDREKETWKQERSHRERDYQQPTVSGGLGNLGKSDMDKATAILKQSRCLR
ncbi:hypothetical protein NDU88_003226 [Pleurodeles waltl]|uniref:Uncharacterized protein n=1 Tax=Pleurodeles waltl TaxID=8319 RepID=A0AAV7KU93_PLEWA|nr:hypothetical protein NDU88_003226 [Pleurodeles waltl]